MCLVWLNFEELRYVVTPDVQWVVYMAMALPALVVLGLATLRPGGLALPALRMRIPARARPDAGT